MRVLLDTGVILRLVNRDDLAHESVRDAVRRLKDAGHETVAAPQNFAEFWNVCTRPSSARDGLGLSISKTQERLHLLERIVSLLPDHPDAYAKWKAIVVDKSVKGVKVHDARLAALMHVSGVTHILSLNTGDFLRYDGVTALSLTDELPSSSLFDL